MEREKETQTAPTISRVTFRHQGVDTGDLEKGIEKMSVATQTRTEKAGTQVDERPLVEAGHGELGEEKDKIPRGWELIWVEDP